VPRNVAVQGLEVSLRHVVQGPLLQAIAWSSGGADDRVLQLIIRSKFLRTARSGFGRCRPSIGLFALVILCVKEYYFYLDSTHYRRQGFESRNSM
jgi:hypothetical protein